VIVVSEIIAFFFVLAVGLLPQEMKESSMMKETKWFMMPYC
jgi:hypothetical protein